MYNPKKANSNNAERFPADTSLFDIPPGPLQDMPDISEVKRCKEAMCNMPIIFKKRHGKLHPYDVIIEDDRVVEVRGSHFDTCEYAHQFRPKSAGEKALGKIDKMAERRKIPKAEVSDKPSAYEFDFEMWFQRYCGVHQPKGKPHRPGTHTRTETNLIRDCVHDFRFPEKRKSISVAKATKIVKEAIKASKILMKDHRGYYLKGEPRVKFDEYWRIVPDGID